MDTFSEITTMVLGDGAYGLSKKFSTPGDTDKQPSEAAHRAAMIGNTIAIAGGGHALYVTGKEFRNIGRTTKPGRHAKVATPKIPNSLKKVPAAGKVAESAGRLGQAVIRHPALAAAPVVAWTGLHSAELMSDFAGRAAMKREHRRAVKQGTITKMDPTSSDVNIKGIPITPKSIKRKMILKPIGYLERKTAQNMNKSFTWEGEFSKVDTDKRQVFGWASIVEINGEPVVDLQGDTIDIDEIEKSAYNYVIKSRKGGDMHRRNADDTPVHSSDMIESFLITPEKKAKMGMPESVPTGWWVGYQINDDEAWNLVKSGQRTGFSIHGRGQRTEI